MFPPKGGGKGEPKKANAINQASSAIGAATSRRANVCELRGLVETGARCQVARGGASAVKVEGHPLLKVLVESHIRKEDCATFALGR